MCCGAGLGLVILSWHFSSVFLSLSLSLHILNSQYCSKINNYLSLLLITDTLNLIITITITVTSLHCSSSLACIWCRRLTCLGVEVKEWKYFCCRNPVVACERLRWSPGVLHTTGLTTVLSQNFTLALYTCQALRV